MAQFTNSATLSFNGLTLTSNTVTGELLETIAVAKTSTSDTYTPGDDLTYAVTLTNNGDAAVTGLTVTDDLGGYLFDGATVYPLSYKAGSLLYFADGVLQADPAVTAGPPLVISGISIPAGGNVTLIYEAAVTAFAPPENGGTITNTSTVTGSGSQLSASETVAAAEGAELEITKALSPAAVAPGDQLTYTFTIENSGNAAVEAAGNAVLADTFDPRLSDLTVTFNGTEWVENTNYTYDETTGVFSTVAGQISVPAATYTQGADGAWSVTPGTSTLTITGTVQPTV